MAALLDALEYIGSSLDKPGRAVRGLLAGRPEESLAAIPFSDTLGITDPARAVSGRGLLEHYGLLNPKAEGEGFGLGDIVGMGAELVLDPTNIIGGSYLSKLLRGNRIADAITALRSRNLLHNRAAQELISGGAMPAEVAQLTKAVDELGQPVRTFHGTGRVFDVPDPSMTRPRTTRIHKDPVGYYSTASPEHSDLYAQQALRFDPEAPINIRSQLLDIRNPFVMGNGGYQQWKKLVDELGGAERATQELIARGYDATIDMLPMVPGRASEVAVFSPSQVYKPLIAPAMREVPDYIARRSLSPLLAAIGGHNVLARAY